MKPVFFYLNYREYLRDRLAWLKKHQRDTSYRSLAKKAGFTSPNFLKLVIDGKRNLSSNSVLAVCQAFELEERECEFFSALVNFNQAKSLSEQERNFDRLKHFRRPLPLQTLQHSHFEYFDKWYHVVIREMASLNEFCDNPKWIQEKLNEKVPLPKIRNSLELLKRLELIIQLPNGRWVSTQTPVSTGDETSSLSIYRFHRQMIQKALAALEKNPPAQRDISSLTLGISQKGFEKIKRRLQEFRKEILTIAQEDCGADTVYQLNMQFFNLTEPL